MSSQELTEWIAFASIEPIGNEREDVRSAAMMHATIAPHVKQAPSIRELLKNFDFWGVTAKKPVVIDDDEDEPLDEVEADDRSRAIMQMFGIDPDTRESMSPKVKVIDASKKAASKTQGSGKPTAQG